jgi:hypothetical protein
MVLIRFIGRSPSREAKTFSLKTRPIFLILENWPGHEGKKARLAADS